MAMYHVAVLLLLAHFASFPHSLACPYCPTPTTPPKKSPPPPPPPSPCPPPPRSVPPVPPSPKKPSPPSPKTPSTGACPIDTLKLDACVDLLGGLVHAVIGQDTKDKCCPVIQGLADLDAALCLCTTIKAKVLDITVLLPIALELLVDCGKHVPSDYQCPA